MLTAFVRAFQTPDLRKKLLITLGLIALFRLGASLPTPGISERNVAFCSNAAATGSTAGVLAIVNLLSGQALLRLRQTAAAGGTLLAARDAEEESQP